MNNFNIFFHFLLVSFAGLMSVGSAWAQNVNIPDVNFKNALINRICVDTNYDGAPDTDADTNNDGEIQVSEALAVEWLGVGWSVPGTPKISDMTGIEQFTNLKYLYCQSNNLTSLNIDLLTLMIGLDCSEQPITSLNVSNMHNLQHLFCGWNALTSIDVNNCPNLIEFYCSANPLTTTLDLHDLVHLKYFECNYIGGSTAPDLLMSNLPELIWFQCEDSGQTGLLDLSIFPKLRYVHCPYNAITNLNLTGLTSLINLNCSRNGLTTLDVQGLTSLQGLDCSVNPLTCILGPLPNSLLFLNTQNTNITCLSNIPAGIAAANTLPICTSPCSITPPPTFHYAVACDNTILWTIDNAQGYTTSYTLTDQNGIDITNLTTLPQEGNLITLTCTNAIGQSISTSQVFTMQDAVKPSFTYSFSNGGNTLNIATTTNGLPQNLSITATPSTTTTVTHAAALINYNYNDAFAVTNANIDVCVKAVYSGFSGNPLNTVCKELCKTIPAQNCATMAAHITGSNVQQGQPSTLTASAAFTPAALASYTYQWNDGSTNAALTVNPTTVATYTVTVTSDRGCMATATAKLPTWDIIPIEDTITCNTQSLCIPLIVNKPIRDGYALTFQIEITGPATIQGIPTNTIDFSTATPGVMPTSITTQATTSGNSTIISVAFGGALNNTINTINPLPNKIGCLNIRLNNAQPNDNIRITGTVTEEYYDPITFVSNSATFGLHPATLHIIGAPLNGTITNRVNSAAPLHSNMTVIATDANGSTASATISTTGTFSIPNGASMNNITINRTTPTDGVPTAPLIIDNSDANITQVTVIGGFTPTSIYDYLAMDVNSDGSITSLDATLIQKRRVGTIANFAGRRWKFVEHSTVLAYTMPIYSSTPPTIGFINVPIIPNNLPINNLFGACQTLNKTYDGILIGDANNSWITSNEALYRTTIVDNFYMAFNYINDLHNGWYEIPITVDTEITSVDIVAPVLDVNIDSIELLQNNNSGLAPSFNTGANRRFDAGAFLGGVNGVGNCGTSILKFKIKSSTPPQAAWFTNFRAYIGKGIQPSEEANFVTADNFCTPAENTAANISFAIFPNPTNSSVTIHTNNTELFGKTIQLYDALGRRLQHTTLQNSEQTIDLSEYPSGVYILQIGNEVQKLVKN